MGRKSSFRPGEGGLLGRAVDGVVERKLLMLPVVVREGATVAIDPVDWRGKCYYGFEVVV